MKESMSETMPKAGIQTGTIQTGTIARATSESMTETMPGGFPSAIGQPTLYISPVVHHPAALIFAAAILALGTSGCASKNYVRSQTTPLIQQTNELDTKTAQDHREILSTDERAQKGITGAQSAADLAGQHADSAGQAAGTAGQNAQDAVNRVDSLSGVVANLDNYTLISNVDVTFGFDKATLTAADKQQLDTFAANLSSARGYLLEVTGGTDSVGDAQYNYQLSQRRADAVVNYLATRYNVPPHKFYLIGIGKDQQIASDKTATGRAKNRRVEIRLMSNRTASSPSAATTPNAQ